MLWSTVVEYDRRRIRVYDKNYIFSFEHLTRYWLGRLSHNISVVTVLSLYRVVQNLRYSNFIK